MVYQYKICPFCNKLKAVMDYLGILHKTTEARNPSNFPILPTKIYIKPKRVKKLLFYSTQFFHVLSCCITEQTNIGV